VENPPAPSPAARLPRVSFGPDVRLSAATGALAVVATVAAAVTTDHPGALLFVLAALVLAGYAGTDLVCRPRLVADAAGLRVRTPGAFVTLAWPQVDAVRADVRMRHGLRSVALEIEAGERLIVLSRRALGTDPERAADLVRAFAPTR
jgi:hypothetical protein